MTGYSRRSLVEKLGIKEGFRIAIFSAPENYAATLGRLPKDVVLMDSVRAPHASPSLDLIHCFVKNKEDLKARISALKQKISPDGVLWISWPKGSSGVSTDLNENVVREIGLKNGLVDVKVCAVDETWSGLKFVYRLKDRP